jgi:diguanylate cyclase (GGDEF)-like protein
MPGPQGWDAPAPLAPDALDSLPGSYAPESAPSQTHLVRRPRPKLRGPDPRGDSYLIPDGWGMVAPAMAVGFLLVVLARWHLPDALSALLAAGSALACAAAPLFARAERRPRAGAGWRYATMAVGVALPMLGFGLAMASLHRHDALVSPTLIGGALVIVSLVASITLSARLPSLLAAQLALWSAMAVEAGSAVVDVALLLGTLMGLWAALRQIGRDRLARAEQTLMRREQLRAEEILADYEHTGQGWFWETDRRGAITYCSPPICRLLGREEGGLVGRPFTELFVLDGAPDRQAPDRQNTDPSSGATGAEGERTLNFHLNSRSSFQDLSVRAATPGAERWWSVSGRPLYDGFNNFFGFRGSGNDLTERLRSEQHASRLAHYDSLTGLANRFQMGLSLEKILIAPHQEHRACAVLLIDLDRFKQVNDTMGHPVGDALLKQVAQRLTRTVDTMGRVGRLGGDEFEVILPGRVARRDCGDLARRIIASLSQPYSIEGHRVVIGASIGIALSPDDGVTSEAIIRNADLALYAAKDRGRGVHHFYDADLHSDAEERRALEQDLRDALANGGLELHYQPVVSVRAEQIVGFEALLRWNHPTKGRLSPAKFIPIAEDTGLIAQIGEWALRTATHALAGWPESVRVAVNVSPLQFANPALPAIVTSALASAQVAAHRLELEITESVFLNDDAGTDAMFAALKRVGVRLALDDFGTGYSALGYLRKAPFDKIKIDQSFVRGACEEGSRNGAIIASIVSLAEALGMETTAEGVETLDELDMIRELGCSHIQGFIYSHPMAAPQVAERLEQGLAILAQAASPPRETRRAMLRKVTLEHEGETYPVTIRNISEKGAMIEGLWNVPVGLELDIALAEHHCVPAIVRWSEQGRVGVQFTVPLELDSTLQPVDAPATVSLPLRKVG